MNEDINTTPIVEEQQVAKKLVKLQGTFFPNYDAFYKTHGKAGYSQEIKIYGVNPVLHPPKTPSGKSYYALESSFTGDEQSGYQGDPNAFVYARTYAVNEHRANLNIYLEKKVRAPFERIQPDICINLRDDNIKDYRIDP